MFRKTKVCRGLMLAFGGSLALGALPAQAQQQLERVEITGSAIKRIDAETSVPVTVIKADDLRKQGVTSVEQIMSSISAVQMQTGTSQSVGAGTGGASFADLRGIGANKTLVLLNGRRIANNALDSSAPDLNMIPMAALDRIEVLRDGASALYGTDAIGGVINFITRKDYSGISVSAGYKKPQDDGGQTKNFNIGGGYGDLEKNGFNIFGFVDYDKQNEITGTQRTWNTREPGGLSPTTFPANYFQAGNTYNPTAPGCNSPNLIPNAEGTGCQITTASFVNYIPQSERYSGMLKGTLKIADDHRLGLEFFGSHSEVISKIAPVPYGGLRMNPFMADGVTPNPYYAAVPGLNPNISPTFTPGTGLPAGAQPGFVFVRWRDMFHGQRVNIDKNDQVRVVASAEGSFAGWDYQAAYTFNENKYKNELAGYSDGPTITNGVRDGIINPFGPQDAAGTALLAGAGRDGLLQTAKGTVHTVDARFSTELGDWLNAGRPAAIAIGAEVRREKFLNEGNVAFAELVVASTGFDPATYNAGDRDVFATYGEINIPLLKSLEVTGALRYDDYSDFGNTINPKVSFRYQPMDKLLFRGSYSTGFRAPSLYELHAAQTYTNTGTYDDPVNCPGGVPVAGKPAAQNCDVQFQRLTGGNTNLQPEKAKNATLGMVFEPVKDSSVALDFWWIKIKQQINAIADATVIANPGTYSNLYYRNANGDLSTDGSSCPGATCGYIDTRTSNLGGVNTNGFDLSASYRYNAGDLGLFGFWFNGTYVTEYEYQEAGDQSAWKQNVGRFEGTAPIFRLQHNIGVNWNFGPVGVGVVAHYKSHYVDQDPSNTVSAYNTYDLNTSWTPVKGLLLTFGVLNVTNQDPPFSNQGEVFQAGYDPRFSDPTGRTYYLRGTYNF